MSAEELFTREEVIGGFPAKRAQTLLYLIEGQTGRQLARARRAMARIPADRVWEEQDLAFLEAFTAGREPPIRPTIQDLERYAPDWASLVPENPGLRAAVVHLLAGKYTLTYRSIPAIRQAFGLDQEAVQMAYQRAYNQPMETIYAAQASLGDRLRWAWAWIAHWLESLPPFWTAYALTLTETVGVGVLALPIALAGIGPLPGVILLLVLGLANVLTIGYMTEAVTRSGDIRYGKAYFGQLVKNLLGREGALVLSIALVLINVLAIHAYFIGFSSTLAESTRLPAAAWIGLLFVINLYILWRKSLNATIAAALVVGAINISVIVVLSLLALPHVQIEYLTYIDLPIVSGRPFDASLFQLVFGVILVAYFGHTSMGNCAKVVLRRDPGGRSLLWGSLAAMASAVIVYCLWLLAVNGTISPAEMAGQAGTALIPLAQMIGPVVNYLGAIFVILGLGMGTIHFSLGLYNLVQEWLPRKSLGQIDKSGFMNRVKASLMDERVRYILGVIPILIIFLLTEWVVIAEAGSFSQPLGFLGVIVVSLLAGAFPVLLLAASRRKGEIVPGALLRVLGHPAFAIGIYLLILSGLFLYGLVIWQDPFPRAVALAAGVVAAGMPVVMAWRGTFAPRAVLEVRNSPGSHGTTVFNMVGTGKPVSIVAVLETAQGEQRWQTATWEGPAQSQLHRLTIEFPGSMYHDVKVWAYQVMSDGESKALPVILEVDSSQEMHRYDLRLSQGQVIIPTGDQSMRLRLQFERSQ